MTEVVIPKTFANSFWGEDDIGYYVLTSKMANSKRTFDDLKGFYSILANLHEEFGKKLLKHLKNELGREESGTLGDLLGSAHKELDFTAKSHLDLANKIKVSLELPLDNFILQQKDQRKLIQTNVDKSHRYKQLHETNVAKAKEKYENECARQVKIESQMNSVGLRESERLKIKLEKCNHDVNTFEQEYKGACIKLADTTIKWDEVWEKACEKFQEMEVKRIEFIHHSFSIYVNILSTSTNQNQESYERFWKSLDKCDPQKDISTYIDENGTGELIPDPPLFVHYLDDPVKTLRTFHSAINIKNTKAYNGTIPDQPCSNHFGLSSKSDNPKVNMTNIQYNKSSNYCLNTKHRTLKQPPLVKKKVDQLHIKMDLESTNLMNDTNDNSQNNELQNENYNCEKKNKEDISIDPRAKVIFSIGNNVFQIDNKKSLRENTLWDQSEYNNHQWRQQEQTSKKSQWNNRKTNNEKSNRKLDETFDLSMKKLLQELGVHDNTSNNDQRQSIIITNENEYTRNPISNKQNNNQPTIYTQLQENYISKRQIDSSSPSSANSHTNERYIGNNTTAFYNCN